MRQFRTLSSRFGRSLRVTVWGGSHEAEIGMKMQGFPAGTEIDVGELSAFLARRAPGSFSGLATARKEADEPEFQSGLEFEGEAFAGETVGGETGKKALTTGEPIIAVIKNRDFRSGDYAELKDVPRPGHADFTAYAKYAETSEDGSVGTAVNMAGGGPFSGRMTAMLCVAGGLALQFLEAQGISIAAHILRLGAVKDRETDGLGLSTEDLAALKRADFPCFDGASAAAMKEEIRKAAGEGDSLGAVVEVFALGLPPGVGGPMYDGLESILAPIYFGIPSVKGVEFGAGFRAAELRGSENNDAFRIDEKLLAEGAGLSAVRTETNRHGGILGGISSGMPVTARLAFKPTPSIAKEQRSVSLSRMENTILEIRGRHDPCTALRGVPVAEAATALGLLDALLGN